MISAPSTLFEIHKEAEESVVTLCYLADCSSFSLGQKKKKEREIQESGVLCELV